MGKSTKSLPLSDDPGREQQDGPLAATITD
jgi:hypothetical protein